MRKIGIIASGDEKHFEEPWFRRRKNRLTPFYMENYRIQTGVFYIKQTAEQLRETSSADIQKIESRITEAFIKNGFDTVLFTKKVRDAAGGRLRPQSLLICDGISVMRELAPDIIIKAAQARNMDLSGGTLALVDDDLNGGEYVVNRFKRKCRYITIVTKNTRKGLAIAENIMDECGMPITVTADFKPDCDFAIINSGAPYSGGKTVTVYTRGSSGMAGAFDWAEVEVKHDLPFEFESLEFTEALRRCGIRARGKLRNVYSGGKVVSVFL